MNNQLLLFLLVAGMASFSVQTARLTIAGAVAGSAIAVALYAGCGLTAVLCLGCFFILATIATSWGHRRKSRPAKEPSGKRDIYQVLANGGLAGFLGLMALFMPASRDFCLFLVVCSLSAATADTVSSELGSVYGKRFFNILTCRKDTCGENGVVSFEGFIFGFAGSCILACIYAFFVPSAWSLFWLVVISGTVGNVADSILGASLERSGRIGNNAVNFLNTLSGAVSGWILLSIN